MFKKCKSGIGQLLSFPVSWSDGTCQHSTKPFQRLHRLRWPFQPNLIGSFLFQSFPSRESLFQGTTLLWWPDLPQNSISMFYFATPAHLKGLLIILHLRQIRHPINLNQHPIKSSSHFGLTKCSMHLGAYLSFPPTTTVGSL